MVDRLGLAAKVRPCLILNIPLEDEDRALLTVVPHTTSSRGTRFEVDVHPRFLKKAGVFDVQNIVSSPLEQFTFALRGDVVNNSPRSWKIIFWQEAYRETLFDGFEAAGH